MINYACTCVCVCVQIHSLEKDDALSTAKWTLCRSCYHSRLYQICRRLIFRVRLTPCGSNFYYDDETESKISQYADDTALSLLYSADTIAIVNNTFDKYGITPSDQIFFSELLTWLKGLNIEMHCHKKFTSKTCWAGTPESTPHNRLPGRWWVTLCLR